MRFLSSSSTQHGESLDVSLESKAEKEMRWRESELVGWGSQRTPRGAAAEAALRCCSLKPGCLVSKGELVDLRALAHAPFTQA